MGIPGSANLLMLGGGAQAYEIDNSLRFRGAQYLTRTNSTAGNRRTCTLSVWVKKVNTTGLITIYTANNFTVGDHGRISIEGSYKPFILNRNDTGSGAGLLRDTSAWYHLVMRSDTTQSTSTNRVRWYVNGVLQQSDSQPPQNAQWFHNAASIHRIGFLNDGGSNIYADCYLAEMHWIDGAALAPENFGEFDDNGVWRPIKVSGLTYGTNGFYMKFDPTATNGLGHDHSGNGNNYTASGFNTTNSTAATYDVMSDTPTTNWATLNPIFKENTGVGGGIFINGNLEHQEGSSNFRHTVSTQALPSSGKVYVEVESDVVATNFGSHFGLMLESTLNAPDSANNFVVICQSNGTLQIEGTNQGSHSAGNVFSLSVDMSASPIQIVVRKNNTVVGTNPYTLSTTETLFFYSRNIYGSRLIWNFGQRPFAYTPPTGYKALNTANLPAPDIADGSQYFNAVTYSGSASNQAITVGFEPDFLWIKRRNGANDHNLYNAIVGLTGNYLVSHSAGGENSNNNRIVATSSTGFTVGTGSADTNGSGNTYVAWAWDAGGSGSSNTAGSITSTVSANPTAGFSIVTLYGQRNSRTVDNWAWTWCCTSSFCG
jgi:hypothetical protein